MDSGKIKKSLVSGLFWVLLANLIVKPVWLLGVEVGVQNAVGNQMYGFYAALFSFSYIFNILLDLGVTNFNTRNIARHPQLINKYLSGILGIKLLLLGLYLVVTFTAGLMMGYGSAEFRLLALLTLCQFFNSLILYLRSNFEGLLLFKWDSLFSVLDRVLMIIICGGMLVLSGQWSMPSWARAVAVNFSIFNFQFSIYHFVYAQLVAYVITATLAFVVIAHRAKFRRLRWNWPFFLVILRKSAPFALLVLLMASYNRIDPILLRRLASDADAGVYAGAFRLLDALTMVAYLVSVLLLPVFSKLCRETSEGSELAGIVRIVFWPMMIFAVGSAVVCSLLAEPIMTLLFHDNSMVYVPVFRVVIFGIIPIGLTYIFGTLLTAGGHLKQLNIFAASSLALNIVANLLLIPHLGAVGSAWASLTTQSFMALAQLVLAIRLFRLPPMAFLPPSPREVINFAKSLNIKH